MKRSSHFLIKSRSADVFVIVQEEYKREGLKWEAIKCMDNSAALELLEGRLGIIDLLNEESMRGQGNDLNFLAKMKSLCGAHTCYASADVKMQKDTFAIKHYAGNSNPPSSYSYYHCIPSSYSYYHSISIISIIPVY